MTTKIYNRMIEGAGISVLDKGAVGDGVTDDTAAFQRALSSGGHVTIPKGNYNLASWTTLNLTNDLFLEVDPFAVITGNGVDFISTTHSITAREGNFSNCGVLFKWENAGTVEIDISGITYTQGTTFINARYSDNASGDVTYAYVANNHIEDMNIWGIDISMPMLSDLRVENNVIDRATLRAIGLGDNASGEAFSANHHVYVVNNTVSNVRAHPTIQELQGIYVTGVQYAHIEGNNVFDLEFTTTSVDSEGIYIKAAHTHIANNTLKDCGGDQGFIVLKGQTVGNRISTYVKVQGNIVESNRTQAQPSSPMYVQADDVVIHGNTFTGLYTAPIQCIDSTVVNKITFTNNTFARMTIDYILRVTGTMKDVYIAENRVYDIKPIFNTHPVFVAFLGNSTTPGGTCDRLTIKNNISSDFLNLTGTQGGRFYEHSQGSDTGASCSNILVDGNDMGNLFDGFYGISGSSINQMVSNNYMYQIANVKLTSGSVSYTNRIVKNNIGQADLP